MGDRAFVHGRERDAPGRRDAETTAEHDAIDSIFQDEPVFFGPDGRGVGTDTARVRAKRLPRRFFGGNRRVYHIGFTADDGQGGRCRGEVLVEVPLTRNREAVDDGADFDSTVPSFR